MPSRLENIVEIIKSIETVKITSPFEYEGEVIQGIVTLAAGVSDLNFKVKIYPQYPFQSRETKTIRFINTELIEYDHVNGDGSICIHTPHNPLLKQKLITDLEGLGNWIQKYYLNKESDSNYEHIIVSHDLFNDVKTLFLFTEVDHNFSKGEFGFFNYSTLLDGFNQGKLVNTHIVQEFIIDKKHSKCKWSSYYQNLQIELGIFVYVEEPPVKNRRFIVQNWSQLEPFVEQEFLLFLYRFENKLKENKHRPAKIPILIGYKITTGETHWQCAIFNTDNFPNYGLKNPDTKRFEGRFYDEKITWVQTKNCSYQYFFGRGSLHDKLTNGNILIIGVGAIGSMVAAILTRGGCRNLTLIDYDVKEPENICRSEYSFISGVNNKTLDLGKQLSMISPFIEIRTNEDITEFIKLIINNEGFPEALTEQLDQFDIIFDCTTDNDIAYILDGVKIKNLIINLSITNHAKELIFAVKPDLYRWLIEIFERLSNDTEDLYRPTGCWSPTFKASYNDIAILVQHAIKYMNQCFQKESPLRNFYITGPSEDDFNSKLNQY